jgi:hypothetical protein
MVGLMEMRFNLSPREKKLVAVLVGVIGVFLWYQVFWENLWPRYQELKRDHEEFLVMDLDLPYQLEKVQEQEEFLAEIRSNIDSLKNRLSSGSGLLVYTISKLAEGRVVIKEIEPRDNRQGPFFQVNGLSVICQGDFPGVIEYLRLFEEQIGLSISALDLRGGQDLAEIVEVDVFLRHYSVPREEGAGPGNPSTLYEPYYVANPFATEIVPDRQEHEEQPEVVTSVEQKELYPLAPYTFPIR